MQNDFNCLRVILIENMARKDISKSVLAPLEVCSLAMGTTLSRHPWCDARMTTEPSPWQLRKIHPIKKMLMTMWLSIIIDFLCVCNFP